MAEERKSMRNGGAGRDDGRRERLAAELRANLARRKRKARAASAAEADTKKPD